ncbi:MAG TPA: hypothetical protein VFY18_13555 [Candidatus Limnocylindrales bacterium]|nr:hypothetical protein [Candidatus Limnocylindrales bacterium]
MGVDRGDRAALVHPVTLAALALLLVNDHVLKAAWPGWWTGKLSDVAALIVGPVAVAALWQLVRRRALVPHRGWWLPPAEAMIAIAFGAMFVAVKLDPTANEAYARLVGLLGWPIGLAGDLLAGRTVQALAPAPTVLDAGDLIALPAVAVGWWLAIGARRVGGDSAGDRPSSDRSSVTRSVARVAALGLVLFALAATTPAYPTSVTDVVASVITVEPGMSPIHRSATFTIQETTSTTPPPPPTSIRIEARQRWPFNEPPLRIVLTVDGTARGSRLAIDPARCTTGCSIDIDVAIDWPGAVDQGPSSAAWELVATVEATPGLSYSLYPDVAFAPGGGSTGGETSPAAWLVGLLAIGPLAALAVGASRRRPRAAADDDGGVDTGVRSLADVPTVAAGVALIGLLAFAAIALPPERIAPPLGAASWIAMVLGPSAAIAIAVGLVRWARGSGTVLAVSLATTALIGLPVAGLLIAAAPPTFAERGTQVGFVGGALLSIAALFALVRRDPAAPDVTPGRIGVLTSQIALLIGLGLATLGGGTFGAGAFFALCLHLAALFSWWEGSGRFLALTSFLVGAGTGLALMFRGPELLFTTPWTPGDQLLQYGVLAGATIGLFAGFGLIGEDPTHRRATEKEERRAQQVADKIAAADPETLNADDLPPAAGRPDAR